MPLLLEPPAVNDRSIGHWIDLARDLLMATARRLRLADAVKAKRLLEAQARRFLHGIVASVEPVVVAVTEALAAEKLKLGGWWMTFRNAIIPGHFAGAMALLNDPDPAPADLAAIQAAANAQVGFLNGFRQQLAAGRQLLSGAPARAALYAHSIWSTAVNVQRAQMRRNGYTYEKNVLAVSDHCFGCLDATAQGWVPIGQLVSVGSRNCLSRCKCYMVYK